MVACGGVSTIGQGGEQLEGPKQDGGSYNGPIPTGPSVGASYGGPSQGEGGAAPDIVGETTGSGGSAPWAGGTSSIPCQYDKDCTSLDMACTSCGNGSYACPVGLCVAGSCELDLPSCGPDPCKGEPCGAMCPYVCPNGDCTFVAILNRG